MDWFFQSWYIPKKHVFRQPNTFPNLQKTFSSNRKITLIQHWTAPKQRGLIFLTHSETVLISTEIFAISETGLFSADLLWDFNPGLFVFLRHFCITEYCRTNKNYIFELRTFFVFNKWFLGVFGGKFSKKTFKSKIEVQNFGSSLLVSKNRKSFWKNFSKKLILHQTKCSYGQIQ